MVLQEELETGMIQIHSKGGGGVPLSKRSSWVYQQKLPRKHPETHQVDGSTFCILGPCQPSNEAGLTVRMLVVNMRSRSEQYAAA